MTTDKLKRWDQALQEESKKISLWLTAEKCPTCDGFNGFAKECPSRARPECVRLPDITERREVDRRLMIATERRLGHPDWRPIICRGGDVPPVPTKDSDVHRKARGAVAEWLDDDSAQGLMLMGVTGSGKSMLAAWLACRHRSPVWVECSLANSIQDWESVSPKLDGATLVVFDDLGHEHASASNYASEVLSQAICRTIDRGNRIVITTNLRMVGTPDRPGIRERYGDRVHSRLCAHARGVSVGNLDLRMAK